MSLVVNDQKMERRRKFRRHLTTGLLSIALLMAIGTFAIFFFTGTFAASAPNILPYQGRLLNDNGVPVADLSLDFQFRIFDAESGGTCLWSNASSTCAANADRAVTLTDGLFTENLGDTTAGVPYAAIQDTVFANNTDLFLEVQIEGEVLSPRKRIGAAGFALNADTLDGLDSTDFLTGGTAFVQDGNSFGATATLGTNDTFPLEFETDGTTRATILANGNVGIGTASPSELFHVVGGGVMIEGVNSEGDTITDRVAGPNIVVYHANSDAAGARVLFQLLRGTDNGGSGHGWDLGVNTPTVGDDDFYLRSIAPTTGTPNTRLFIANATGNVGIGTTTPEALLAIGEDGLLSFEGATNNAFETFLTVVDPTADNTITFQDASGTVAFLSDITGGTTTLQQAYDNDADGGDATITTNATDGNVLIAGSEDFGVDGTTFYVDNSANSVGIGTTSPAGRLHLSGFSGSVDGTKGVRLTNTAGTVTMFEIGSTQDSYVGTKSASSFSVRSDDIDRMTFRTSTTVPEIAVNDSGADYDFRIEGDNNANLFFADASTDNIGIRTATPGARLSVIGGSLTDDLATGASGMYFSGTLQNTGNSQAGVRFETTGNGSTTGSKVGLMSILYPGFTGSSISVGLDAENVSAGTGNSLEFATSSTNPIGNSGFNGFAYGTTTGLNVGGYAEAANGNLNVGSVGKAITAKASATNIGAIGTARNTNLTSPIEIGGYFGLFNSTPTFDASAGLIASNGSTTNPIFLGRDNNTTVFTIVDGGNVGIGDATPEHFVDIEAGSLDATEQALSVSGTLNAALAGSRTGVSFNIAGAGSAGNSQYGGQFYFTPGYTGAAGTYGLAITNENAGTGSADGFAGDSSGAANIGAWGETYGSTTGTNVGAQFTGALGATSIGFLGNTGNSVLANNGYRADSLNYAVLGASTLAKNGSSTTERHIGVAGTALNGDTNIGGYFGLRSAAPNFTTIGSAALVADNGTQSAPILLGRDNTTTVFTIADGGEVTAAPVSGHAGDAFTITGGSLATTKNALKVTGTLANPGSSSFETASSTVATTSGSANSFLIGSYSALTGTATGNARNAAVYAENTSPGTGTSPTNLQGSSLEANYAMFYFSGAATAGYNVGASGYSADSTTRNYGVIGAASARTGGGAATNAIGVYGVASQHSGGATGAKIGGMFTLYTSDSIGTLTDSALIADNGAVAAPIFLARDNGTTVFSIADGGAVSMTGDLTVTGNILPGADDTYDLGSNTARWRDLYLGPATLHIGTSTSDEGTIEYDTSGNKLVVNEAGADTDFRVESVGNANLFFVDAGNDRVGIGTASPAFGLDIQTAVSNTQLALGTTGQPGGIIFRRDSDGSATASSIRRGTLAGGTDGVLFVTENSGSGELRLEQSNSGFISFSTALSEKMRLSNAGFLGIGTTTPDRLLDIEGAHPQAIFGGTASGQSASLRFRDGNGTERGSLGYSGASSLELRLENNNVPLVLSAFNTGGNVIVETNSIERLEFRATTDANEAVFNDPGNDYDFRIEGDNQANLFFADASTDRIGIGDATPEHVLDIEAGTLTSGVSALAASGTIPNPGSTTESFVLLAPSTTGASNSSPIGLNVALGSGFTGARSTFGALVVNSVSGTASTGIFGTNGNIGIEGQALGTSSTASIGVVGYAEGSTGFNVGALTQAYTASSGVNIGNLSTAANASGVEVAGFFMLRDGAAGNPSVASSAALLADNGSFAENIFVARDNGTAVFTIADGGALTQDGGAVFNEAGADVDFRIEGTGGITHAFNYDAGLARYTFGVAPGSVLASSDFELQKSEPGAATVIGVANNSATGNAEILAYGGTSSAGISARFTAIGPGGGFNNLAAGSVAFLGSSAGTTLSSVQMLTGTTSAPLIFGFNDYISTSREFLRMTDGTAGVVFNEDSLDRDFRVETDGNANGIFLDASAETIDLVGGTASGSGCSIDEFGNLTCSGTISGGGGGGTAFVQNGNSFGAPAVLGTNDTFGLSFETDGTSRMTINTTGEVGIGELGASSGLQLYVYDDNASTSATVTTGIRSDASKSGAISTGTNVLSGFDTFVNNTGVHTGGTINNFGARIDVAGTTNGTQTNTGLSVSVAGADTNYAALFSGGNVGIGDANPVTRLHVATDDATTSAVTDLLTLDHTTTGTAANNIATGIVLRAEDAAGGTENVARISGILTNATNASEAGAIAFFTRTGGAALSERVRIAGNGDFTSGANVSGAATVLDIGTNAPTTNGVCHDSLSGDDDEFIVDCSGAPGDVSEWYETTGAETAGDIVAMGSGTFSYTEDLFDPFTGRQTGETATYTLPVLERAASPYQGTLLGVVARSPNLKLGEAVMEQADHPQPVAISGRVPVRVNLENGPIAVGDPITSSSVPGVGMKATEAGKIIGYALEPYQVETGSMIMAFINLTYYSGDGSTAPTAGTSNQASGFGSGGTANFTSLNMDGDIFMHGHNVIDVGEISGLAGAWSIEADGTMKTESSFVAVIESYQGENVETYATLGREHKITLDGTATLQSGSATVAFEDVDPSFNDIISTTAAVRVSVTANGPVTLYVSQKDHNGFTVQQLGGIDSGTTFDWFVSAYRKDYEPVVAAPVEPTPAEATPAEPAPTQDPAPTQEPAPVTEAAPEPSPVVEEPAPVVEAAPPPAEEPAPEPVPEPTP